ncbi:MAG: cyclopropane-fatty-acyl-phospholipid synthase family protein [Pseudomonadota bacterium]|nr:cyclopropane-fatty-acyl-phospholipid synthase family protein [Pseudomonadota bacterium]
MSDTDALRAVVRVHHPQFYARILFSGTVGAGEAYADGQWDTDDLTAVVRVMVANQDALQGLDSGGSRWVKHCLDKLVHMTKANTRTGSRKNIAAHYDLNNEFFRLWLDNRMMYSSAVFPEDDTDLETASQAKLQRLCEMLDLQPDEHLLEIGTGWGGLAIYAASQHGVRVTTTTISQAQFDEAQTRVKAAGLERRVEVLLEDYRDLQGQYDKIVSVEMVEAVGDEFVDGYFRKVESLLAPAGKFVMQAITIQDQRYTQALREVDFIKKHIFPGSFIPSVSRLVNAAGRTDALILSELRDIGVDYAKTLRCWSKRFTDCSEQLATMGFDERFQRLWQFYFSYCEGGFRERAISDVQVVFNNQPIPCNKA